MWMVMSTRLPVSSTRLISTNTRNCSIFPWSPSVQSEPGPSLPLVRLLLWLYQCQYCLCSVGKEQHDFSTKIKVSLCIKGKYSLLSLELAEEWTWRWTVWVAETWGSFVSALCIDCSRDAGALLWIHLCREEWLKNAVVLKWGSCFL